MYSYFYGKIQDIYNDRVVLNVNDIGYEIYIPGDELSQVEDKMDQKISIYTHFHVREDDMKLFGFLTKEKLNFFKKLILVSGVGPKLALGIISNVSVQEMSIAIATENIMSLKQIPGIGPKMAQKIIFELKDKVMKEQISSIDSYAKKTSLSTNGKEVLEAINALEALGFTKRSVEQVIAKLDLDNNKVEDIIKKVLFQMQK